MNTLTLGVRNAFRNTVRTASIVIILGLSLGLCLIMLLSYQAVGAKITDIKRSVGNTITISPAGFSNFSQANNTLTTDSLAKVATLPHIANLTESLTDRLTTIGSATPNFGRFVTDANANAQTNLTSPVVLNSDGQGPRVFVNGGGSLPANFSLPISIIGTTDPTKLNSTDVTRTSGKNIDGSKDANTTLISASMASKNNLAVGSTFTAYGETFTVAGIFDTGNRGADNTLIVSLPTLQRLTGQANAITSASAVVDSVDNLSSTVTAVKNSLGSNADVQSAQDEADATIHPLQNVQHIALISLFGAIIAGAVIILLTMIMIVRERRREIGILKAIGASNTRIILQFVSEAVTLTLAGALVGIAIGIVGGNPVTDTLVSSSTTVSAASTTSIPGSFAGRFRGSFAGGQDFGARPVGGNVFQRGGNSLLNSARNITVNIGWSLLAYGLGAALLTALLGSSFAGWMIARVKPYEVMRAE